MSTAAPAKKTKARICKVKARTNASKTGSTSQDTIAQEKKLRSLLANTNDIDNIEQFTHWKDDFANQFEEFLNPEKAEIARKADEALHLNMKKFAKTCIAVRDLCESGSISEEKISVKGQNALNELVASMEKIEQEIKDYFPKTQEHEKRVGYSKFDLAAVQIKDGFRVYDIMITTRDYVVNLRDGPLDKGFILKPNSKSIMGFYLKEIESFCDTMADLGMHKLMGKCAEMYKIRPRKKKKSKPEPKKVEPEPEPEVKQETPASPMFKKSKEDFKCIMDNGWASGVTGGEVKGPTKDGKGKKGKAGEDDDDAGDDTPQKPTDYVYYFDPVTETIGKVPRKLCLSEKLIVKKQKGEEVFENEISDWEGEEGKSAIIWTMKEALKGKSMKGNGKMVKKKQ